MRVYPRPKRKRVRIEVPDGRADQRALRSLINGYLVPTLADLFLQQWKSERGSPEVKGNESTTQLNVRRPVNATGDAL